MTKGDYRTDTAGSTFPNMSITDILGVKGDNVASLNFRHLQCTEIAEKYMAPGGWTWGDKDKGTSTALNHAYGYGIIAMASHFEGDFPGTGILRKSGQNGQSDSEPIYIGLRALDIALSIRTNPVTGDARSHETWYQMMKDAFMPLLKFVESQEHTFSVVSRTHLPRNTPMSQVEGNAFLAKVAELTCILVSGRGRLGSKTIPDIVAKLEETWDTHAFAGRLPGEVRGKCESADNIDTYTQDLESVYGIKFKSPLKRVQDNKEKVKPRVDHAL